MIGWSQESTSIIYLASEVDEKVVHEGYTQNLIVGDVPN
jgi:hypothetical protein